MLIFLAWRLFFYTFFFFSVFCDFYVFICVLSCTTLVIIIIIIIVKQWSLQKATVDCILYVETKFYLPDALKMKGYRLSEHVSDGKKTEDWKLETINAQHQLLSLLSKQQINPLCTMDICWEKKTAGNKTSFKEWYLVLFWAADMSASFLALLSAHTMCF